MAFKKRPAPWAPVMWGHASPYGLGRPTDLHPDCSSTASSLWAPGKATSCLCLNSWTDRVGLVINERMHSKQQAPSSFSIHVSCHYAHVSRNTDRPGVSLADVITVCPNHCHIHVKGKQSSKARWGVARVALVHLLSRQSLGGSARNRIISPLIHLWSANCEKAAIL